MSEKEKNDLTVIHYTANRIDEQFAEKVREHIKVAAQGAPIISVSQAAIDFGHNIVFESKEQNTLNIYRQSLIGAKAAETEFIGLAEDDILYAPDHFTCYRPEPGVFGYNLNFWLIYTWVNPPLFSYKGRRNLYALICRRDDFIRTIEERFAKYPDGTGFHPGNWGEPGKYERSLGVTVNPTDTFMSELPGVAFSHEKETSFENLGTRKRLGDERKDVLPHWGSADAIMKIHG